MKKKKTIVITVCERGQSKTRRQTDYYNDYTKKNTSKRDRDRDREREREREKESESEGEIERE